MCLWRRGEKHRTVCLNFCRVHEYKLKSDANGWKPWRPPCIVENPGSVRWHAMGACRMVDICVYLSGRFSLQPLLELRSLLYSTACRDPCFPATLFRERLHPPLQQPALSDSRCCLPIQPPHAHPHGSNKHTEPSVSNALSGLWEGICA